MMKTQQELWSDFERECPDCARTLLRTGVGNARDELLSYLLNVYDATEALRTENVGLIEENSRLSKRIERMAESKIAGSYRTVP